MTIVERRIITLERMHIVVIILSGLNFLATVGLLYLWLG